MIGEYRVVELGERELPDGRVAYSVIGVSMRLGAPRTATVRLTDAIPASQGQRRAAAREVAHALLATDLREGG